MRLALYQPDIPQNTGTLLRLGACLGVAIDVIGPTGFDMSDRALRRSALDYIDSVDLTRHTSFSAFCAARQHCNSAGRLILLSTHATTSLYDFRFAPDDTLLLGRESSGVPDSVTAVADARLRIPITTGLRSLNIAVAGAMAVSEALRQTGQLPAQCGSEAS